MRFLNNAQLHVAIAVAIAIFSGVRSSPALANDALKDAAAMAGVGAAAVTATVALTSIATRAAATSTASKVAFAKGACGVGAAGSATAIGGVIVATTASAEAHHDQLKFDDSSRAIGTSITIRLMQRNAELAELGEITPEERDQRNDALVASARQEMRRSTQNADFIAERYADPFTACVGTVRDGWDLLGW